MSNNTFKNVDTSDLSPEQLAAAEQMAEYTRSRECKTAFNIVNLAEKILVSLVRDQRHNPVEAFALSIKYAEHAHAQGEMYMQANFEDWKKEQPAPELVEGPGVEDLEDVDASEVPASAPTLTVTPDPAETITRDQAVADTEARNDPAAAGSTT